MGFVALLRDRSQVKDGKDEEVKGHLTMPQPGEGRRSQASSLEVPMPNQEQVALRWAVTEAAESRSFGQEGILRVLVIDWTAIIHQTRKQVQTQY